MRVLVIPEDFRKDQYIVKPIITKMFAELGRERAKVEVCLDPNLGGVGEALKWEVISEIIHMYRAMTQVFILLLDRDCDVNRRAKLDSLEQKASEVLDESKLFVAEAAWQELEVWALAGLNDLPKSWKWKDVRKECHPKETYFEKHAERRDLTDGPGQGRVVLGRESATNYARVRSLCVEDVAALEKRLREWVKSRN